MSNISKSLISVVIAFIIAASSSALVSSLKADAKSISGTAAAHAYEKYEHKLPDKTTKKLTFAKAYLMSVNAKNAKSGSWNYRSDAKNIKVNAVFNTKTHNYNFKFTGNSYGLNHITLKYKVSSSKWESKKLTLFVDSEKNIMRTK